MKKIIFISAITITPMSFLYIKKINKNKKLKSSLYYQVLVNQLKLDDKAISYLGSSFEIDNAGFLNENNKNTSFQINANGIRGSSTITFNLKSMTKEEIDIKNEHQQRYSLLSSENRRKNVFLSQDYNDTIIPTENTIDRVTKLNKAFQLRLNEILTGLNEKTKDRVNNFKKRLSSKEAYFQNYENPNFESMTIDQDKSIENPDIFLKSDTFWVLSSITLETGTGIIMTIRPKSKSNRKYNIEDTYLKELTPSEILHKLEKIYVEIASKECQIEDKEYDKSELLIKKKTNIDNLFSIRKRRMTFNSLLILFGFGLYFFFNKKRIDIINTRSIKKALSSIVKLKETIGEYNIIYCTTEFKPVEGNYFVKLFLQGLYGKGEVVTVVEFNNLTQSFLITSMSGVVYNKNEGLKDSFKVVDSFPISIDDVDYLKVKVDKTLVNSQVNKKI